MPGQVAVKWFPFTAAKGEFRAMFPDGHVTQRVHTVVTTGNIKISYSTYSAVAGGVKP